MAKTDKISVVCFMCLRNTQKKKSGHGYGYSANKNNLLLLKRFLSWSLDLPPAVIGDLLSSNVGTEGSHGENLICGSCEMEMDAACKLYQELTKKLMELEEILENSVKRVSGKMSANLHQKIAKQLNHSFWSAKEGGRRVQRLRDLLTLKLATAKAKIVEDEVSGNDCNRRRKSGSGTSEIEDFQGTGTHHENHNLDEAEAETPGVTFEFDQGDKEDEESGATQGSGVNKTVEGNEGLLLDMNDDDDDGGGCGQHNGGSTFTAASTVKGNGNLGLGVGVELPFMCLRCSESFRDIDSVQRHHEQCKPLVSSGNGNSTSPSTSEKANMKPVGPENEVFLREDVDVDIDVNMEVCRNSPAVAEAEADDDTTHTTVPFQCLRCNDRFKNIEDVEKHEEFCKPLVSSGNGKSNLQTPMEPENNERLFREAVDIFMNMEEMSNLSAAAETEADGDDNAPFECLRCNDRFKNIEDVEKHEDWCKPLVSSGSCESTPPPRSENVNLKKPMEPENARFLQEDVINMEERSNSFAAAETEAEDDAPFQCLRCNDRFNNIEDIAKHEERCKPLVSNGNGKSTPPPTSEISEQANSTKPGNGMFHRKDVDISMEEEQSISSTGSETEADDDVPFQCLRCNDRFENIEDVEKHEKWCKPLKVHDLEIQPGPAKKRLRRGIVPYSGPGRNRNSKLSKIAKAKCRICDKNFLTNYQLKIHKGIHMGVKSFQCPKCKMRFDFNQKSNYITHLKKCKTWAMKNGNEISKEITLKWSQLPNNWGNWGIL